MAPVQSVGIPKDCSQFRYYQILPFIDAAFTHQYLILWKPGCIIPGYKSYVAVDGGMTDNPRYALYGSNYTVLDVMAPKKTETFDLVGRCCESGDIIQPEVGLNAEIKRGDLVAVCTTGAYNYSMASNYNRVPRPPIVMLGEGGDYLAVRRETLDDIVSMDV